MSTKMLCLHYQDASLAFRCLSSSTNQWPTPLSQSPKQAFTQKRILQCPDMGPWRPGTSRQGTRIKMLPLLPRTQIIVDGIFFPVARRTRGYDEYGFVFRIKGFLQETKPVTPSEDTLLPVTSGHTWVGQSPLDFRTHKTKGTSTPVTRDNSDFFSCGLIPGLGTGQGSGSSMEMALNGPVCQVPNHASSQEIPSNLWSRQLIVLDLWWRIAASAWGPCQLSRPMVGAGEHAVALWCGDRV
jgi:hypothetical protein